MKYNSVFYYAGTFYASPYSSTGIDWMDGAIPVCGEFNQMTPKRLCRLLNQVLFYGGYLRSIESIPQNKGLRQYVLRKLYSLECRLVSITGIYAARSILETLDVEHLAGINC